METALFEKGEDSGIEFAADWLEKTGWPSVAKSLWTAWAVEKIRMRKREKFNGR